MRKKRITVILLAVLMVISCVGSVSASTFTKTEKTTYRRLVSVEKFSSKDACAIMGAMKQESGVRYDVATDMGHGVMLWSGGRYKNLQKMAKKEKKSWKDGAVQRKFIKSECKSMGISKKLSKTSSLKEKSKIIAKYYTRIPEKYYISYYRYAKKYYENRNALK